MIKAIAFSLFWVSILFAGSQFQPAGACGQCHDDIYEAWLKSMHANASVQKDPLFKGMVEWAARDSGGKLTKKCIGCHSPMNSLFKPTGPDKHAAEEGVTCQFCHGAKEISGFQSARDIKIDPDSIYGNQSIPQGEAHAVTYRDFFSNGNICLPCHAEMKNGRGLKVCATGEEWESYRRQTGKSCPDCHMPQEEGVRSHLFPGTQNGTLLKNAVDMKIAFNPGDREVAITLTNSGAGHALPTGTPLRMVILKVIGIDNNGSVVWENWKENPIKEDRSGLFMKILGDAKGNGPVPPWQATQILYERRLMPGEPVTIRYRPEDQRIRKFSAKLLYRLAPPPIPAKFGITDAHFTQPKLIVEKDYEIAG